MKKELPPLIFLTHGYIATEDAFMKMSDLLVSNYADAFFEAPFLNLNGLLLSEEKTFTSIKAGKEIEHNINNVVELSLANPTKAILCRLRLCGATGSSDVNLQVSRLRYLIEHLVPFLHDKRPFVLIGHSQGGLVNLLATTYLDGIIDQVISISTPYRDVQSIKETLVLAKLSKKSIAILEHFASFTFGKVSHTTLEELLQGVFIFGDNKLTNLIKDRFKEMENRPRLDVICGVAGIFNGSVFNWRRAYDGLVTVSEQQDIDYDERHIFSEVPLPCLEDNRTLINASTRCLNCSECKLPEFNFRYILKDLRNKVSVDDLTFDIIDSGFQAIKHLPIPKEKEDSATYKIFYKTFDTLYNHQNILFQPEVADKIVEILVKQDLLSLKKNGE